MPLKAVLETLDDLNEDHRGLYVESEGKFYLDLDADSVKYHPATKPIAVALDRVKGEVAETKTKLAEALTKLEAKPNPTKADEAEMIRMRETLERERDEAIAERDSLKRDNFKLTVENQLDAELRRVGVNEPAFVKAARRELLDLVKVVNGVAVVQTSDLGDFSLSAYVNRWASSEGAAFVSKPAGGGATGSKGGTTGRKPLTQMTEAERREFKQSDPDAFRAAILRK